MKRKPLPIYLSKEERERLEKIKECFGNKTLSSTIQTVIKFIYSIKIIND